MAQFCFGLIALLHIVVNYMYMLYTSYSLNFISVDNVCMSAVSTREISLTPSLFFIYEHYLALNGMVDILLR